MLRYDAYRYLWPPRPIVAVPRELFHRYASWWAQAKKNGTQNVLAISPDRQITAMNRHRQPHKLWQPNEATRQAFLDLPGGWYVFVAELLHSKVSGLRNINYIHDILVADSIYLVGTTFQERQELLIELFRPTVQAISGTHYVIDQQTWLAINHRWKFPDLFETLVAPEDEGLVFKQPAGRLRLCVSGTANSDWQRKSRRASKTYLE